MAANAIDELVRLVIVDTNLLNVDMHNFNFARGVRRDGPALGLDPHLIAPRQAPPALAAAIGAQAILSVSVSAADPLMRDPYSWRIAETIDGGAMLADDLARLDGAAALADALVMLPTASAREMMALALAVPRAGQPLAVVLGFHSLRTGDDRRATNQAMGLLRYAMNRLRAVFPAERIIANATTIQLAQVMADLLDHPFRVYPHPIWYDLEAASPDPQAPPADGRATFVVLGGNRRDKGAEMLADIATHALPLADRARLLLQVMPRYRQEADRSLERLLTGNPVVAMRPGILPESALLYHCQTADAVLLPYEPEEYRDRASGIFALAVAMGCPVVVPAGTWMADRLEAGEATGVVVSTHAPFAYAAAMARILEDLAGLKAAAVKRAAAWRGRENGRRHLSAMIRDLERAGLWPAPHIGSSG